MVEDIRISRRLNLLKLLGKSSFMLLGARGVGKSYLIRSSLKEKVDYINLLRSDIYLDLQVSPHHLETYISKKYVVIDEVQRIPELLNEVHRLIEEKGIRFGLTGSSARKLRKKGVNLLAGRALNYRLFPFSSIELKDRFNLERYLLFGGLPMSYLSSDPQEYLNAYVQTYLKEEIFAEALVRNLANYHRFLEAAAQSHTEIINFTKIGSDAQLSPNTVRDYFQILEDTLIGELLPAWKKSTKRKAVQSPKFYFFDIGVANSINKVQSVPIKSELYGKCFESFIYQEIKAYLSYSRINRNLCYWRSVNHQEVDFVIDSLMAIEVKSKSRISPRDLAGLKAISEECDWKQLLIVSNEETPRKFEHNIRGLHWKTFLKLLWEGELI